MTLWTVASVHGILQARILAWVATSFSRGSSWLRDRTWVSCIAGRFFANWATSSLLFYTERWLPPLFLLLSSEVQISAFKMQKLLLILKLSMAQQKNIRLHLMFINAYCLTVYVVYHRCYRILNSLISISKSFSLFYLFMTFLLIFNHSLWQRSVKAIMRQYMFGSLVIISWAKKGQILSVLG